MIITTYLYLNDNYSGLGFRICLKMQLHSVFAFYVSFDTLFITPLISYFSDESMYKTPCILSKKRIPTL